MGGFLGGSRTAPKHLWLLGNSPLYWPDGSKAGVSYRTVQITANVSRPKPKLMCTVLRADRQMPKVEVCFTADSFKRATKRPPARLIARPKIVPQMVLEPNRITGNRRIVPGDKTKLAMKRSAQTRLIASIKMCLNDQGAVATAKMIKRSGYPDYDRKLQAGIRAWRYKPFKVNGRAVPVCTSVTFIYSQS